MEIHAYVTSLGIINEKPMVVLTPIKSEVTPKEWVYAYSFDHEPKMTNDELRSLFEKHQKTIITPEQEIVELKAKISILENDNKGGFIDRHILIK